MAEVTQATKKYAVVTGANKGIGFEICRQLASKGVMVVLTARNQKRGDEAVDKLKEFGLSDNVVFHQLDVADPSSIACLVEFVKTQFSRLDILVNNAGIAGVIGDTNAMRTFVTSHSRTGGAQIDWSKIMPQTYDLAVECLQINYYGAKRMIETFIPLLQLSESPRIVNVSSGAGKLKVEEVLYTRLCLSMPTFV